MQNTKPTVFVYLRVSTERQDLDNQRHGVIEYAKKHNLEPLHFAEDTVSGTKEWTDRGIGRLLLKQAKAGDIVITSEFSRLARSALQVMLILEEAAKRQITIHIVKNGMVMDGSLNSRVMTLAFGMGAEIERDFIAQRTKESIAHKRALIESQGYYINSKGERREALGRPKGSKSEYKKLDKHADKIKEYLELGVPKQRIMEKLDCCEKTLYAWMYNNGFESYIKSRSDVKSAPTAAPATPIPGTGKRGRKPAAQTRATA